MHVLYLANVGNRDVRVDGTTIPREQARATGAAIRQDYAAYRDRLGAPILETGLRAAFRRGGGAGPAAVSVYLFATNQDEAAGSYRAADTANLAHVLEQYLREQFPAGSRERAGHVEAVRVIELRGNPSLYDEMYEEIGRALAGKALAPDRWETCYVSPVGGTPAANFGLLLRAVERYGERCHTLYVTEGRPNPVRMEVGRQLRRGTLRAVAEQELAHHEFGRAAVLLEQIGAAPTLVGLAEHARDRLHFDFAPAAQALEDKVLPSARGAERALALDLRDGLDALLDGRLEALIGELYFNARITYREGRYVDFLLRLFRWQEAVLRLLVERGMGLPTDVDPKRRGRADPGFVAGIESNAALLAHVREGYQGERLDYERAPTRPLLCHLLAFHLRTTDDATRARDERLVALLHGLDDLAALRNKSIGGHGFEGVSEAEVERRYGSEHNLLDDLAEAMRLLGLDPDDDPFERVRAAIVDGLARER